MKRSFVSTFLTGVLLAPLAVPAHAAASKAGTTAALFLRVPQEARALGMGGAFTAVAEGAQAMWWNPAGLAREDLREVSLTHTQFIEGIKTEHGALSLPLGKGQGTVGVAVTYLSVSGIEGYDASKNPTGDVSVNSYAGSLAYATRLGPGLYGGAALKYVSQTLDDDTGNGLAADAGVQMRLGRLTLGGAVSNLGPELEIGGGKNKLPMTLRGGGAYAFSPRLQLAADVEKPTDNDMKVNFGVEWRASGAFAVRLGHQSLKGLGNSAGLSAGFSIFRLVGGTAVSEADSTDWHQGDADEMDRKVRAKQASLLSLDYAFVSYGDVFDATHRVSVGLKF